MRSLRSRLILAFLAATVLPFGATVWVTSSLLDRSLAYATTQKTHEIGIRMALGAQGTDVLRMVVRTGFRLVVTGIAIGIVMSLALGRTVAAQLVNVTAYDPPTLAATTLLLTIAAAFACWMPARRAARVDPMVALRCE